MRHTVTDAGLFESITSDAITVTVNGNSVLGDGRWGTFGAKGVGQTNSKHTEIVQNNDLWFKLYLSLYTFNELTAFICMTCCKWQCSHTHTPTRSNRLPEILKNFAIFNSNCHLAK